MMSHDEATLLAVKFMVYGKGGVAAAAMGREV